MVPSLICLLVISDAATAEPVVAITSATTATINALEGLLFCVDEAMNRSLTRRGRASYAVDRLSGVRVAASMCSRGALAGDHRAVASRAAGDVGRRVLRVSGRPARAGRHA